MKGNTEKPAYLLLEHDRFEPSSVHALQKQLENGTIDDKIEAMKKIIHMSLSGGPESLDSLLMFVIRFVLPVNNHFLRKLMHVYWDVVNKRTPDGKLKQEFILVCNALRNELIHPNEYVRSSTLRNICHIVEPDILEPLVPSIRENLEDRHAVVRKNAVNALHHVYSNFDYLAPDAPEIVRDFLLKEGDAICKRNAFVMLCSSAQDLAVEYLESISSDIASFDDIFQLSVLELIRKLCRQYPQNRSKYMKVVIELLSSQHPSVQFEAAGTLVSLSTAAASIRAASSCYIDMLSTVSDQNVRLIILDKLSAIKQTNPKVIEPMVMDVLRALSSPNVDVRMRTLQFAMEMVTDKNVMDVVKALRSELIKGDPEMKQKIIESIHYCSSSFPGVADAVSDILLDSLQDANQLVGYEIMMFFRDVMATHEGLRNALISRLLKNLKTMKLAKVVRMSLWVISEFGSNPEALLLDILNLLKPMPFTDADAAAYTDTEHGKRERVESGPNAVLADGTYATQVGAADAPIVVVDKSKETTATPVGLRDLVLYDSFVTAACAACITKLTLQTKQVKVLRSALLALTSMLRIGREVVDEDKGGRKFKPLDNDTKERILVCMRILTSPKDSLVRKLWLEDFKKNFSDMLAENQNKPKSEQQTVQEQPIESLVDIKLLKSRLDTLGVLVDEYETDLEKAMGVADIRTDTVIGPSKTQVVHQMSGIGDDIYVEAKVFMHEYDVVLDLMLANVTNETLQGVLIEINTVGDLKLCEHPQTFILAPKQTRLVTISLKVSSTDTGLIFGSISYDVSGAASGNRKYITLNELVVDIKEYLRYVPINDFQFRLMWGEYEWENKIVISADSTSCYGWLKDLLAQTNLGVVLPVDLSDSERFLSANIYGRTIFGEDVVANVSVELENNKVAGFVRIRAKSQGMAVSLGDKIVRVAHNLSK